MELQIKGKNTVISEPIRDYIEKKMGMLDRYLPDINEVRIEVRHEQTKSFADRNVVQITARASGKLLRAEERAENMYACIDTVTDKIRNQIARYKEKRVDRRQGHVTNANLTELVPEVPQEPEGQIVRVKHFAIRPMSSEEAVEEMELLSHNFFVFFNAEVGRVNVLYRRADGDYGLLDPELA